MPSAGVVHPIRICLVPRVHGIGGMVSFRERLTAGLTARGIEVCHSLDDMPYQAVLVIGGTRQLYGLFQARRRGVRIVQRLDGMNWLHRVKSPGLRGYLRAEFANLLLATTRSRIAQHIVYQSQFARSWWERERGPTHVPSQVIYNSVDLKIFTPDGVHQRPTDRFRVLMVEGSLMGGYEIGLEFAFKLLKALIEEKWDRSDRALELMVVGRVPIDLQAHWEQELVHIAPSDQISLVWAGSVEWERIPQIDRSAHLLYSADVNAACPNSVIEAMACGLPVLAFDTGALPELVQQGAGRVVAYASDPWRLENPDIRSLGRAAIDIFDHQDNCRLAARARAEAAFGLEQMVDRYVQALFGA